MVTARVDADRPLGAGAAEKSCILLWLCGGPSHLDTWDPKPEAAAEIRGPYRPIATAVPGMQICELAPKLAKVAQHFSIIRSMMHVGNIRIGLNDERTKWSASCRHQGLNEPQKALTVFLPSLAPRRAVRVAGALLHSPR